MKSIDLQTFSPGIDFILFMLYRTKGYTKQLINFKKRINDPFSTGIISDGMIKFYIKTCYGISPIYISYPLLLTRTIEATNETDPWKIDLFFEDDKGWGWSYKDYRNPDEYYNKADEAKEAVLLYLMSLEDRSAAVSEKSMKGHFATNKANLKNISDAIGDLCIINIHVENEYLYSAPNYPIIPQQPIPILSGRTITIRCSK